MTARKRVPSAAPPADNPVGDAPTVEQPTIEEVMQGQERDSIASLMAELGGVEGSRCTVYRLRANQPQVYVFACAPHEFSLDNLRDKYNGGEFRIFVTRPGHTGVWRNLRVCVEERAPGAVPPASDAVVSVMREGFALQAKAMDAMAQRLAAPSGEPVSMATILRELPALITAAAAALTALRPPVVAAPPASGMNDGRAIDLLLKGVDLARELPARGGGDDDNSLMGMLRELMRSPMLGQAMAATMAQQPRLAAPPTPPVQQMRPQQPQQPQPQPVQQPPAPEPATPGETQVSMLTYYLGVLVAKARDGADPTLYAELVMDNLPDESLRVLLARQPDTVTALAGDHPGVGEHRAWFEQLVATIRETVDAEDAAVIQGAPNAPNGTASHLPGESPAG